MEVLGVRQLSDASIRLNRKGAKFPTKNAKIYRIESSLRSLRSFLCVLAVRLFKPNKHLANTQGACSTLKHVFVKFSLYVAFIFCFIDPYPRHNFLPFDLVISRNGKFATSIILPDN